MDYKDDKLLQQSLDLLKEHNKAFKALFMSQIMVSPVVDKPEHTLINLGKQEAYKFLIHMIDAELEQPKQDNNTETYDDEYNYEWS